MESLKGRIIAVVTGAGSGVGRAVAEALAREGASVALVGRRMSKLEAVVNSIQDQGGHATPFACDVSSPEDVEMLQKSVTQSVGTPNVLFNGAGVFLEVVPIAQTNPRDWIKTMQTNTIGPYLTCRAFMGGMVQQCWGRIINVSSAAVCYPPGGHSSSYQLSKIALNHFTRQLAAELTGTGVTANVFHPGEVKTEMWQQVKDRATEQQNTGMLNWATMVEQTGGDPPERSADLVLKLLRPESDSITGQFLWIEGGIKKPLPAW